MNRYSVAADPARYSPQVRIVGMPGQHIANAVVLVEYGKARGVSQANILGLQVLSHQPERDGLDRGPCHHRAAGQQPLPGIVRSVRPGSRARGLLQRAHGLRAQHARQRDPAILSECPQVLRRQPCRSVLRSENDSILVRFAIDCHGSAVPSKMATARGGLHGQGQLGGDMLEGIRVAVPLPHRLVVDVPESLQSLAISSSQELTGTCTKYRVVTCWPLHPDHAFVKLRFPGRRVTTLLPPKFPSRACGNTGDERRVSYRSSPRRGRPAAS